MELHVKLTTTICLAVALVAAVHARAHAQASPEAEKLFRDGRQLIKDGKIGEACAAFEASEKVEHNIATLLNLADCREKNQQYAAAWALFLAADSQTRGDASKAQVNGVAKQRASALEQRLSYLTINVPDESRVTELIVTRDGEPVDPAEWNRAIPVDGGKHEIAGRAPGHEPWSTTVTIAPALDKQAVEVPKFKELPKLAHPEVGEPNASSSVATPAPPPAPSGILSPRRDVAIGLGGGALLAVGAGVAFGLSANNLHDQAVSTCPPSTCSAANASAAQSTNSTARSRALLADGAFAAGGVFAAAAVTLWLLGAPESAIQVAPAVGTTTGVSISGRF